jgi:small subunit ribosomal protein S17e
MFIFVVAIIASKRLRNKIAGYVTHLMTRIQTGPVRGISLKLQEEERERRENYVPEKSIMEEMTETIEVDADTKNLLRAMGFGNIGDVQGENRPRGTGRPRSQQ